MDVPEDVDMNDRDRMLELAQKNCLVDRSGTQDGPFRPTHAGEATHLADGWVKPIFVQVVDEHAEVGLAALEDYRLLVPEPAHRVDAGHEALRRGRGTGIADRVSRAFPPPWLRPQGVPCGRECTSRTSRRRVGRPEP